MMHLHLVVVLHVFVDVLLQVMRLLLHPVAGRLEGETQYREIR
jgi:hypothetical protein